VRRRLQVDSGDRLRRLVDFLVKELVQLVRWDSNYVVHGQGRTLVIGLGLCNDRIGRRRRRGPP